MFKAAFPGATEEEEEREMRWVSHPLGFFSSLHYGEADTI